MQTFFGITFTLGWLCILFVVVRALKARSIKELENPVDCITFIVGVILGLAALVVSFNDADLFFGGLVISAIVVTLLAATAWVKRLLVHG